MLNIEYQIFFKVLKQIFYFIINKRKTRVWRQLYWVLIRKSWCSGAEPAEFSQQFGQISGQQARPRSSLLLTQAHPSYSLGLFHVSIIIIVTFFKDTDKELSKNIYENIFKDINIYNIILSKAWGSRKAQLKKHCF